MSKQQFSGHVENGAFSPFLIDTHNFSLSQSLFICQEFYSRKDIFHGGPLEDDGFICIIRYTSVSYIQMKAEPRKRERRNAIKQKASPGRPRPARRTQFCGRPWTCFWSGVLTAWAPNNRRESGRCPDDHIPAMVVKGVDRRRSNAQGRGGADERL